PRPPAPKAGALTGLRYTPNLFLFFQSLYLSKAMQRYGFFLYMQIFKAIFFYFFSHYYLSNYKSKH
ncbi:MAG: hypothetical protein ACLU17_11155, partial [Phocaeicola vulgatus]|uniref:hypothetical protein n=1 Tax=Phocaeicola vulgatus TaxID=821 RepID=UPI003A44799D